MLEMVGPDVTPEHGVTGYAHDRTRGPACAMAAGAATIYRNQTVRLSGCSAPLDNEIASGPRRRSVTSDVTLPQYGSLTV
jgi:hypothetical protein